MCCRGAAVRRPPLRKHVCSAPRLLSSCIPFVFCARSRCRACSRASFLCVPLCFRPSSARPSLRAYWLLLRRGFRLPPRGFCLAFVFPSVPAAAQTLSLARPGVAQVTCDAPLSFCPRSPRHAHPSSPAEVSAALAAAVPPAFRRVQCRGEAFVGRLPRAATFSSCAILPSLLHNAQSGDTGPRLAILLGACVAACPRCLFVQRLHVAPAPEASVLLPGHALLLRVRRRFPPAATAPFRTPRPASCGPSLHTVVGRAWPRRARRLRATTQLRVAGASARPLPPSLGLMARPPRRRARHTLQALCCRLALRTPLRPLQSSLPCICGARRHAMRGPPTMAALLARKLGQAHASRRGRPCHSAARGTTRRRSRGASARPRGAALGQWRARSPRAAPGQSRVQVAEGGAKKDAGGSAFTAQRRVANHTHRNCVTEDSGSGRCADERTLRRPVRAATRVAGSLCREARRTARGSGLAARRRCHARADSADRHPAVPARIAAVVRGPCEGKGRRHGRWGVVRQIGAGTASSDMATR
ncbi:hypothetical protein ERJ75_001718900 [Trypanosoma vivax]|nr:hypothetical protein ERJ75_001718900 [Trypanosoma vivax]